MSAVPERGGAEPWEAGADAICAAMAERSVKSIKRVSEDLYEAMMNDVQDWLRENVTYNLSGELSRRDHEIASLKDLLSTAERKAELYDHIKLVAEAAGFESLTQAIVVASKAQDAEASK